MTTWQMGYIFEELIRVGAEQSIEVYFEREVKPHVPDAWIDHSKRKVGCEIPLTLHFYQYKPPRP